MSDRDLWDLFLRFRVRSKFLREYEVHVVGSGDHQEYWIPAGDLARFNENIVGEVELIAEFCGERHSGE